MINFVLETGLDKNLDAPLDAGFLWLLYPGLGAETH
jgi:hypothetical protein